MDIETAMNMLELNEHFTSDELRKKYRRLALQKHPDKNGNTKESCDEFRLIHEAYVYLKEHSCIDTDSGSDCDKEANTSDYTYVGLLAKFLSGLKYNDVFIKIVQEILASRFSWKLVERIDTDMLLSIYNFLSSYRLVFGVTDDILDKLKDAISNKYKHVYVLNPKLSDLLSNNIYKLIVDEKTYMVPLWHKEIFFDCSNNEELIVLCEPIMPDNIKIDEDNNILVDLILPTSDLFTRDKIIFNNDGLSFEIPVNRLFIKREQSYKFTKAGITKITDDIYNISDKSDVIVNIRIS
jgi:hypothetical protein